MPEPMPDIQDLPVLEAGPLFEAHPLPHYIYDLRHLRLLAVNASAVQRYGYTREALLNLTRLDLLLGSERAAAKVSIAGLPDHLTQASQWTCRERASDGRVLHSDTRGMTGVFNGRPARLVAVVDAVHPNEIQGETTQFGDLFGVAGRLAQIGAWSVDLKTKSIFWSDVVCEIHEVAPGYQCTLDEAVAFYPGEAAPRMRRAVKRCLDDGIAFEHEVPFVGAKGRERWVRASGEAVCDAEGRVVALRGALQDITQSKLTEIELQDSRMRLAATLRAIPDLWFILDREGRYLEVSSPEHPCLAIPWEKAVGRKFHEMEGVPSELVELARQAMQRLEHSGEQQTISYERETPRMGRRAFEARLVQMLDGRILYLTRDVTELLEAQRSLEGLLKAIPDLWFVLDAENRYVEVSSADDERLAMPWSETVGRNSLEVLGADLGRRITDALDACRRAALPQSLEYKLQVGSGETMCFDARFVPLDKGRVLLFSRDVTAYRR